MSEVLLEEISPRYVREKRLDLSLDTSIPVARAGSPLLVNVSYARTLPEGVMLPLVLEVQGPSAQSYQRREFTRTVPSAIVFTAREGGPHLVVLREVAHNRWWGALKLDLQGELIEAPITV